MREAGAGVTSRRKHRKKEESAAGQAEAAQQAASQAHGRDLRLYGPISRFQVEILAQGLTNIQADETEERYIKIFKASGSAGYNNLPGCPGQSKMFWWRYSAAQRAHTCG
eukprot:jgi/Astpho2/970/fgenesh1_pg.00016_%23_142_t